MLSRRIQDEILEALYVRQLGTSRVKYVVMNEATYHLIQLYDPPYAPNTLMSSFQKFGGMIYIIPEIPDYEWVISEEPIVVPWSYFAP